MPFSADFEYLKLLLNKFCSIDAYFMLTFGIL